MIDHFGVKNHSALCVQVDHGAFDGNHTKRISEVCLKVCWDVLLQQMKSFHFVMVTCIIVLFVHVIAVDEVFTYLFFCSSIVLE